MFASWRKWHDLYVSSNVCCLRKFSSVCDWCQKFKNGRTDVYYERGQGLKLMMNGSSLTEFIEFGSIIHIEVYCAKI